MSVEEPHSTVVGRFLTLGGRYDRKISLPICTHYSLSPTTIETVKDTIDTILEAFRERIRNPLLPAFVISWCAYNWRILIYCVSDELSAKERVSLVAHQLPQDSSAHWVPVLIAVGYAVIVPFAVAGINWIRRIPFYWDKRNTAESDLNLERAKEQIAKAQADAAEAEVRQAKAEANTAQLREHKESIEKAQAESKSRKLLSDVMQSPMPVAITPPGVEALVRVDATSPERILALDGAELAFVKRAINNDTSWAGLRTNAKHLIDLNAEMQKTEEQSNID